MSAAPAPLPPAPRPARTVGALPGRWRHKWADRTELSALERATAPDVPLLVAADGTVLETTRGNVFLLLDDATGTLLTPPLRDDLLPGITRRALLDLARDLGLPTRLRCFTVADLAGAAAAFWTSSLSGLVPITAVDGVPLGRRDEQIADLARGLGFADQSSGVQLER